MRKIWDVSPEIEVLSTYATRQEMDQRLDEMAELVYRHFCQLSANRSLAPETIATHVAAKDGNQ